MSLTNIQVTVGRIECHWNSKGPVGIYWTITGIYHNISRDTMHIYHRACRVTIVPLENMRVSVRRLYSVIGKYYSGCREIMVILGDSNRVKL